MRLEGKVALITGGSRGIGAASARLLAAEGARVAIADVRDAEGEAVAGEIRDAGGQAAYVHLDVTSEAEWSEAVSAVASRLGRLDVLVNNAGITARGMLHETTEEEWDRVMEVNAKGVFLGTKAAIPEMRRAGGGSIVNVSSQLGLVALETSSAQYHASKGAVRLLTKLTAIQYAADGIRCNSVHPGPIATPMSEANRADPRRRAAMIARVPLGRYGEPEEVARAILFLASDEASFVTGSEVVVDGGWTAQ